MKSKKRLLTSKITMSVARAELIAIQKRWIEELKQDIYHAETRTNRRLDEYYEEYRQHFKQSYEREMTRAQIAKTLSKVDIAYFGDYHTLKLAQTTYVSLVDEMVTEYDREVVLALELVESRHQRFIDDYLSERMSETEFLEAINYDKHWGFPWPPYRRIFEVAKRHNLRVVGINLNADGKKNSLDDRDKHSAKLLAALRVFRPNALIAVLFGDLHVAECHLPKVVNEELALLGASAKTAIYYQNSETLYWELVAKGHEARTDAVRIRPNVYCIMNATPLTKFQSWVGWLERDVSIPDVNQDAGASADLSTHFFGVVETLDDFIGLNAEGTDDYTLYTSQDLDFLANIADSKEYSMGDVLKMRELMASGRSIVIAKTRTLFLSSLALNESAWLAARFLRLCCIGAKAFTKPFEPKDAFYVSVFEEAMGTVGTLIMNPRYRVMTPADHEKTVFSFKGKRRLTAAEREMRETSRAFLAHYDMVDGRLKNPKSRASLRSIYRIQAEHYLSVTRAVGRFHGAMLFHAIQSGEVAKSVLAELFRRVWEKDEPFETYMEVVASLGDLPDILRPISQSL